MSEFNSLMYIVVRLESDSNLPVLILIFDIDELGVIEWPPIALTCDIELTFHCPVWRNSGWIQKWLVSSTVIPILSTNKAFSRAHKLTEVFQPKESTSKPQSPCHL